MRRRLLRLATGVSVALFVAVVVLWARSYWVMDTVGWGRTSGQTTNRDVFGAASGWGRVVVVAMVDIPPGASIEPSGLFYYARPPGRPARVRRPPSWLNRLGFFLMSDHRERGVIVHHWFLLPLLAALPGYRAIQRSRRRRLERQASCPPCGPDRVADDQHPLVGSVPKA
jgi:hypothetical protein